MTKQKMIDLLYELMKDSKRSDRELAKVVGVSQPTITRMRKTLENLKYVREYTVIPEAEKLGFEVLALNFVNVKAEMPQEFKDWILKNPKIVFAGFGEGAEGNSLLLVSLHKNFTDFSQFVHETKKYFGENIYFSRSFLFCLNVDVVKPFSLKNLERVK